MHRKRTRADADLLENEAKLKILKPESLPPSPEIKTDLVNVANFLSCPHFNDFIYIKSGGIISERTTTLEFLGEQIDFSKSRIPKHWPERSHQKGPTCGLKALEIAIKDSGCQNPPMARKNGNKDIISLRKVAKDLKMTSAGEMYNVNDLKMLADVFKFPYCKVEVGDKNKERYIKKICDSLNEDYSVIVACEVKDGFPSREDGYHTHWALVFAYYCIKDEYYFLVNHHGNYYSWSATELFLSNLLLPVKNPRAFPDYYFFKKKDGKSLYEVSIKNPKLTEDKEIKKIYGSTVSTLADFALTMLLVPNKVALLKLQQSQELKTAKEEAPKKEEESETKIEEHSIISPAHPFEKG